MAYCWKLASMGVPVLLIYLGFTGDGGIADVGPPLRDEAHWQSVMRSYSEGVLPGGFSDRGYHAVLPESFDLDQAKAWAQPWLQQKEVDVP